MSASLNSESSRGYRPGHVLGNRYELVSLLGEGGTGVVWTAHDRVLNLEVAVKLMLGCESARDDAVRRAQLEARSAARLTHPAVCRAVDFGFSSYGEPFIVSELLGGESLEASLGREGRMEATRAVRVLLPILDALRAAHENGIVHRDVKPANVFLAREGAQGMQPKLLDFGIAHWLGDTRAASDGVCGTPEYMSPEQASGAEEIDARSDLWNFCATLYEVLTGVVPFRGESYAAVLVAVQTVDPAPITAFGAGDDELAAIVGRGLRRGRDERWESAGELAAELCRWLLARGIETDICDRSLRARLVERPDADAGSEAPYAHVVPGNARRGGRTWRFPVAVAAAAAAAGLVALAGALPALRAGEPPFGTAGPKSAAAAPRVAAATVRPAAIVTPEQPAGERPAPPPAPASPERTDAAPVRRSVPAAAPAAPQARIQGPRSAAPAPSGVAPEPRVAPSSAPQARRRAKNALNYDFGL